MNGIHDMGGMHGFGPVDVTDDVPFHAEWEKRVRAMANLAYMADFINLDAFRSNIERMAPADYLEASYFERWLSAVESGMVERGFLTRDELDTRLALIRDGSSERVMPVAPVVRENVPVPAEFGGVVQRFDVGDRVRVRNVHVSGHTRSPRYLRGKAGVIGRCHGHEVFPDTNAHYCGDRPQVVYSVSFEAREIWGESADPAQILSMDLWDSYLEPA